MPATLIIKVNDNVNAPDGPSRWRAGELITVARTMPPDGCAERDVSIFYTFTVTDKTYEEMTDFVQEYTYNTSMEVYAGPDPSGLRRIRVRNDDWNDNYSPDCDWTVENTTAIADEWNELYPTANLIILDIPQPDYFECEGTFTVGQAQEFEDVVHERGLAETVRRRQWYITPAGMANIGAAGGHQEGTAQQLGGILVDRVVE